MVMARERIGQKADGVDQTHLTEPVSIEGVASLGRPARKFRGSIEYDPEPATVRVGVVAPFDFGLDWEYWHYLPEGVELYFTRTPMLHKTVGIPLARAVGHPPTVARAAKALSALHPAAVLYACSSGSFVGGVAGEAALTAAIVAAGARRAITSSGAMVEALRAAGVERVGVASPYTRPLSQSLVSFLEEAGFTVPVARYLGITGEIGTVSKRTIADLVRDTGRSDVDAVFVSCTAMRTYGIVADLEAEIGTPVFTANQVSLWSTIRATQAEALAPEQADWVLGGGQPMARSTRLLIEASHKGTSQVSA